MVHRAEFHGVLLKHIPEHVGMHTSKRLVSYSDPEDVDKPMTLVFADGTQATCDLLVGADGVNSSVRATMFEDLASRAETPEKAKELRKRIPPRFSGAIAYRGVIPREKLIKDVPGDCSCWRVGKIVRFTYQVVELVTDDGLQCLSSIPLMGWCEIDFCTIYYLHC